MMTWFGRARGPLPQQAPQTAGERAADMDLYGGSPFSLVIDKPPPAYPSVSTDLRTDVIIVGGGITGALCAYHLTEAGVPCIVVDARSLGTGSTCASTSLLQYDLDVPLHTLADTVGLPHAVRAYLASMDGVRSIIRIGQALQVGATHERISFQYASKRQHVAGLRKEATLRNAHRIPVEFLGAEETAAALTFSAPASLCSPIAAETDAFRLTHALHQHSSAAGARVFERTLIREFRDNGSGIQLRTTTGHVLRGRHLIYATGYGSQDLLPKGLIDLNSTFALISKEGTAEHPWRSNALIWETARPYLYMRTAPGGRIMVGGRDEPFRSPTLRDALLARKTDALVQDFARLMPDIPLQVDHAWCGTFGQTKDGLPYIDRHPRDRNSWFALGMGGNGITFSACAAEILRDRILGRPNPQAELFRFSR